MGRLFLLIVIMAVSAMCSTADTLPDISERVYLIHVGESDRPIAPILFSSTNPSPNELLEIVGEPFWRYVDIFVVEESTIQEVIKIANQTSQQHGRTLPTKYSFGTFRLISFQSSKRLSVYLDKNETISMVKELLKVTSDSKLDISPYLRNLLRRLGYDNT